ncbi:MAG TPA: NAD(P)/FAD-dependent oxidoreductase, partial [Acidimicrobiales bacterium]|nr:NAD(P)/FAD-dependent oxidoreductase [Acidimicrobiales bacterium]
MKANGVGHNGPLRLVIVGGGMAGILAAIKLQEAGFTDITIYEKAARLGGTWRENTYPGVACDVPSHLYSYSFAPNPEWSHVFSPGPEILGYLEQVAKDFGVEKYVQYSTEVTRMAFDDGRWHIITADGRQDAADAVIAATGVLHHPSYPAINGIDRFAGPLFHTARWDHSVALEGIRLGVIGTGSSAVQVTGDVVDVVDQYFLFQRTAQWVMPMSNPPIDAEKQASYRDDPSLMARARADLGKMFEEGFANAVVDADSPQVAMLQQMCEANLDTVADPELRERLRPNYRAACKRLIISPNFYEAIQRPNAHLVTEPIEQIEPEGVRTMDGALHELDVLVLATGFRVDRFLRPIEVVGLRGQSLDDAWDPRPWGYMSISVPGFPNLFMLNGPNGPVGNFSLIDVAELQFGY